ncbi:MAG: polyphosphate polymerase domain-containing protein [Acidimicrobiales bacterium]|nr:polyphosphate polymerase domain-containing protein [Acidimicrobiales bacterium]
MTAQIETNTAVAELLAPLGGIELDELNDLAAYQTRRDHKYLIEPHLLADVLESIKSPMRVLEIGGLRSFAYRSIYFDTPELTSYFDAAHNRPKRFKVRSRSYLDAGTCWIEVKARIRRDQTAKERVEHQPEAQMCLVGDARGFVETHPSVPVEVDQLDPTIITGYRRATIHCGQRVTIDSGLWSTRPNGLEVPLGSLNKMLIIETKSDGTTPGEFDHALWSHGIRPISLSKYAVAMATANPHLPANRWHRVLTHHVGRQRMELTG